MVVKEAMVGGWGSSSSERCALLRTEAPIAPLPVGGGGRYAAAPYSSSRRTHPERLAMSAAMIGGGVSTLTDSEIREVPVPPWFHGSHSASARHSKWSLCT